MKNTLICLLNNLSLLHYHKVHIVPKDPTSKLIKELKDKLIFPRLMAEAMRGSINDRKSS